MPIKLSETREFTKSLTIAIPGLEGTIELRYRPGAWTYQSVEEHSAWLMQEGTKSSEAIAKLILRDVAEWDLIDDEAGPNKGKPVPLTLEGIERVPGILQQHIRTAIEEDRNPPTK